jgi:ribonuclease HI
VGLIVHVDGGSRGNPGPAGAGVLITSDDGTRIHEGAYYLGRQTNNAAEYHALIRALQRVERTGERTVTVYSDSELLVRQITGQYRVKSARLGRLFEQVQLLLLRIPCWNVRHIPREGNLRADELANLAMDQQRDVILFDAETGERDEPARATEPRPSPDAAPNRLPAAGERDTRPGGSASEAGEVAEPAGDGVRAVRVTLARPPKPGDCPAEECLCESFTVESKLPTGLCVHAAHALLPTILAVLNTEPAEFPAVPTLTVRCTRPGCGATFHVAPARGANGAAQRNTPS